MVDESSGYAYYVNTASGESSWDEPVSEESGESLVVAYNPDDPVQAAYWAVVNGGGSFPIVSSDAVSVGCRSCARLGALWASRVYTNAVFGLRCCRKPLPVRHPVMGQRWQHR